MQGIASQIAAGCQRVTHESRIVKSSNRFCVSKAGCDDFSSAGVARHEVWLDETRNDAKVRVDESSVESYDRPSGLGFAHQYMSVVITSIVIDNFYLS